MRPKPTNTSKTWRKSSKKPMKGTLGITLELLVLEISRMFVSALEDYLTKPGLPKRKILFQMI